MGLGCLLGSLRGDVWWEGMSDQTPPPHDSENTAPEITTRSQIVAHIAGSVIGGGLAALTILVIVPWVENLSNISEGIAMLLSFSILLNICFVAVLILVIRSKRRQNRNLPTSIGSITPPISG